MLKAMRCNGGTYRVEEMDESGIVRIYDSFEELTGHYKILGVMNNMFLTFAVEPIKGPETAKEEQIDSIVAQWLKGDFSRREMVRRIALIEESEKTSKPETEEVAVNEEYEARARDEKVQQLWNDVNYANEDSIEMLNEIERKIVDSSFLTSDEYDDLMRAIADKIRYLYVRLNK